LDVRVSRHLDRRLLFLLFVFEASLFWAFYHREIAWAPPLDFDQAHYLVRAYDLQEDILAHGLGRLWKAIWSAEHSAGIALPIEGAVAGLIIGGTRFPQLCVNLVLYLVLQAVAFSTGRAVWGRRSDGYSLVGLILCQATPWLGAGGLFDFRMDFAAYCLYGVWTCIVLRSKLFLDRTSAIGCGVAGGLLVLHRFLTAIYLAAVLAGFAAVCAVIWALAVRDTALRNRIRQRLGNLGLSSAVLAVLACPVLLANSRSIWNYYGVGHVVSEEKYIRAAEVGVHDFTGHLFFYPGSIINEHWGPIFWLALVIAIAAGAAARLTGRAIEIRYASWNDEGFVLQVVFLLGATLGPILVLTADILKSRVVGGIVGVPAALLVIAVVNVIWPDQKGLTSGLAPKLSAGGAVLVLSMGILNQLSRGSRHSPAFADRVHLEQVAKLDQWLVGYAAQYRWKNPTISLDLISSSLNSAAITAAGFERTGWFVPFQGLLGSSIFKTSREDALTVLAKSDFVILTSPRQPGNYPFTKAIEGYWPDLKEWADKHLVVAKTQRFDTSYPYAATVYVRPTAVVRDLSGDWITSKGISVEARRTDLERFPVIRLKGAADFASLPKMPAVTATLESPVDSASISSIFRRIGNEYEVHIDTSSIRLPADQIVKVRVKFDTYFVRKNAALHDDFRELVVRSPDVSLLPAGQ
jgi:hypothetical protein